MQTGTVVGVHEIRELRHYSSAELRPLLEWECAVWAESLRWDYRSSMEMVLRYVDSRILPGHVVVEDGAIVGYAFHVFEGSKGVMGDLFVDSRACESEARATQLRDALVVHVIAALQSTPGIRRL